MRENTGYHLRPAEPSDETFLFQLYSEHQESTAECLYADPNHQRTFLKMQYRARNSGYATMYPAANNDIICNADGLPMGRLLTARSAEHVQLVDLALLRVCQKQGIGSRVLVDLQQQCSREQRKIRLHVLYNSPAMKLYSRLGFSLLGNNTVYAQMEWKP